MADVHPGSCLVLGMYLHLIPRLTFVKFLCLAVPAQVSTMGRLDGKIILMSAAAQGIGRAAAIVSWKTFVLLCLCKVSHSSLSNACTKNSS